MFGYQYASGTQGLVSKISLPNTAYISDLYDGLARLTNTTLFNSTNAALDYVGYAYNNANQRTEQWRGAATTNTAVSTNYANYTYDPISQLTSDLAAELIGSTNRMNEQLHYAYDAAGNLAYRTNNTLVENFQVNSVNELTTGTNGGRLTVMGTTSSQATNVTVNGTNALVYGDATFAATNMPLTTAYTAIARDGYGRITTNTATVSLATNSSFQYDLNGNLTNDGTMSFGYDDENQLTQVWVPTQWFSQFTYDGKMRRRIRQEYTWSGGWVQTNIVYYVYDGNVVIQERDINHLATVTYTRGKDLSGSLEGAGGIGGLLARTDMTTSQGAFYHADGDGNVTMLVNSYQAVVAKYLYDAFGNTLSLSGPLVYANLYRFSSKEVHQNSGLVYYLYRYYDPNLQRWLNGDPTGEAGGDNLYQFTGNNPVNFVDPYGLWWWDRGYIQWGVGGMLGLIGAHGATSQAWSGFAEGWSKGGQGVANDFTGGLFDSKYGLFYGSFDRLDNAAFDSGVKCDSAFKFGSAGGRMAEGSLLTAGAVAGAFYAPGTSIFYSGAEQEAVAMAAQAEGSTILNTLGGRFLQWTGTQSQFLWQTASAIYASVSSSEAIVLVGAQGGSTLGTVEIPILVQNGVRLIVYTFGF